MAGEPILIANNCALIFVDEAQAVGGGAMAVDNFVLTMSSSVH